MLSGHRYIGNQTKNACRIGDNYMRISSGLILGALLLVASMGSSAAQALPFVNIRIISNHADAFVGDDLLLSIFGDYSGPATLLSGGLTLVFDPAVVSIASVTVPLGSISDIAKSDGTIDNFAGNVSEVGFASFGGVSGQFLIATVDLRVLGVGTTHFLLSDADSAVFPWVNSDFDAGLFGGTVVPQFSGTSINVSAVPLPLPVAMMGSALLGLMGIERRRHV